MIMILWGTINFIFHMFRIRKIMRDNQNNPNIKGIKIVNGQVEVIEKDKEVFTAEVKEEVKDLVTDPVCNTEIERAKAYHMIKDEESHYFCSWDCREKFLESNDEEHL